MNATITNFGGNIRFAPHHFYAPATEAEVLAILDRHAAGKIRVVGARHSWSPAIVSDDALVDLRHFDGVAVNGDSITVGGGCRIKHLLRKLHKQSDYTMPSIGLITEQTIAGAISTATHGSGKHSLSHYMDEIRFAAYDAGGKARIHTWNSGDELRAARCGLGCLGIILSVKFRGVPRYDVAERLVACDTLDDVLKGETTFPLQQFYLSPHRWSYLSQQRRVTSGLQARRDWLAVLYRFYWHYGIDIGLHLTIKAIANSRRLTRFFFRHVLEHTVPKNVTVTDRAENMLVMEHELFRHLEMELFVPARHLRAAMSHMQEVLTAFDQDGTFTHHYPICIRRVLADDAMLSMAAGETHYAISLITYTEPRDTFFAMADYLARSMAKLFAARPHWGKYCPLDRDQIAALYPELTAFRALCEQVDPRGVFRNDFVQRVLFRAPGT
jgi:FAD/FMN-containing dehydrogenase